MKHSASIEMAPSFSLFNQSFDSFGDGHYFNVEASLQNDSFGIGRTGSADPDGTTTQLLRSSSGGNFAQQLLAASGSGTLAIGYSPVNSFGNMSAGNHHQHRRGGSSTMVVGGPDPRAASPTQVLGMYRSYSNGGVSVGRPLGPLDDSHLRMSVGSFGAPSMAYSRSYGGEPCASPGYYYGPSRSQDASDKTPPFYIFLKRYRAAFKDCTFLLPGLKAALLETPLSDSNDPSGGSSQVTVDDTRSPKWDPMVRPKKFLRALFLCSITCVLILFLFPTEQWFVWTGWLRRSITARNCYCPAARRVLGVCLWWQSQSGTLSAPKEEYAGQVDFSRKGPPAGRTTVGHGYAIVNHFSPRQPLSFEIANKV